MSQSTIPKRKRRKFEFSRRILITIGTYPDTKLGRGTRRNERKRYSTETASEEERNKMVTKRIMEKKNDTIVETERNYTIEKTEEEQEEEQEGTDKNDTGTEVTSKEEWNKMGSMHDGVRQGMDDKNNVDGMNLSDMSIDKKLDLLLQMVKEEYECKKQKVMDAKKQKVETRR